MEEGGADIGLFLVDGSTAGLKLRSYQTIDAQLAADIWLDNVSASCITEKGGAILSQTAAAGAVCLSAEAVGLMDVMKDAPLNMLNPQTIWPLYWIVSGDTAPAGGFADGD